MASDIVLSAEGLGKKYIIGHEAERERYVALRDVLSRSVRGFARSALGLVRGHPLVGGATTEEFWALRDVNFTIRSGEVVGIIGRNGAGKSTLLKLLSRITEPTEGRVTIRGRVASLLEVGTGFHPELTGRENIYLNGAILGMTRAEIRRSFDEIVAFSEVEKFLDTPVKRYSSGMYVRLAFAVAAHLKPEILIVDEVLAVGDVEFQKKCLGKMGEVAKGGRTVLFVSHNMGAVQELCSTSIHLAAGAVVAQGETSTIINGYLNRRLTATGAGTKAIKIEDGLVLERASLTPALVKSGDAATLKFVFSAETPGQIREGTINIFTPRGVRVAIVDIRECGAAPFKYNTGRFEIVTKISSLPFVEGDYRVGLYLVANQYAGFLPELVEFSLPPIQTSSGFASYPGEMRGFASLETQSKVATLDPCGVEPAMQHAQPN